nr:hypothetical protein [uncultured Agathobaculum sp.]
MKRRKTEKACETGFFIKRQDMRLLLIQVREKVSNDGTFSLFERIRVYRGAFFSMEAVCFHRKACMFYAVGVS